MIRLDFIVLHKPKSEDPSLRVAAYLRRTNIRKVQNGCERLASVHIDTCTAVIKSAMNYKWYQPKILDGTQKVFSKRSVRILKT